MAPLAVTVAATLAPAPRCTRGVPCRMDAHPKKNEFVYCAGKQVVVRSLDNPAVSEVFTEHQSNVVVARYSPSGSYVASGDESGKVLLWSAATRMQKISCSPIGSVLDMSWSFDNERIAVVGSGQERRATVIFAQTGVQVSPLPNLAGRVNTVAFKPSRPFRVVTGGEDGSCTFFSGPPFVVVKSGREHAREVFDVKYVAGGARFVTAGGDGAVLVFDGATGDKLGAFADSHDKPVYSVSVSADGKRVLTTSADRTARIWDVETMKTVQTFDMAYTNTWADSVLGSVWSSGGVMVCVNAGEVLSFLDERSSGVRLKLGGHTRAITSMARVPESPNTVVTAGMDNRLVRWNVDDGVGHVFSGAGHDAAINCVAAPKADTLLSGAVNGGVLQNALSDVPAFGTAPIMEEKSGIRAMASAGDGVTFVAGRDSVSVLRDGQVLQTIALPAEPQCVALSHDKKTLAVGDTSNAVLLFALEDAASAKYAAVATRKLEEHRGAVTAIAFSPDGRWMATGDTQHQIFVWDCAAEYAVVERNWVYHTSRIEALEFSPNSQQLVSCGRDGVIIVWSMENHDDKVELRAAHRGGATAVHWVDDVRFVTTGADYSLKVWKMGGSS